MVLSNLGENLALRFFMKAESVSKILISKATVNLQAGIPVSFACPQAHTMT
jgi:hypothetical protein